jgi:hypothetical protein
MPAKIAASFAKSVVAREGVLALTCEAKALTHLIRQWMRITHPNMQAYRS